MDISRSSTVVSESANVIEEIIKEPILEPAISSRASSSALASSSHSRQLLVSCMIGNALEWYDFVIYGYFAVVLGSLFFPKADPLVQTLASWGVFWTGFLARPLGSIVFGHIGDKTSRKHALTLSIYVMAIPTALMGCLPSYEQVGLIATLALILLRTLQGFAIGGEFTGTMVFLVEHAPEAKRGLWGSWASFSAVLGVIIGSMVVTSLNASLPTESVQAWGWRIPFLISILGSVVGGYMRRRLSDPSVYLAVKARKGKETVPLKELFSNHKSKIATIILLDFLTAIGFFIVAIFLATFFRTYLKFPDHSALTVNTINMVVFAVSTLIGGYFSDRLGRKPILLVSCLGFIIFSYPIFQMMQAGNFYTLLGMQAILAVLMGLFFGTIPTTLAEIMPTGVRFSGLSIAHNISMAIFGGGAPFAATHLIQYTENLSSPAYLLIAASCLSLCSLPFIVEHAKKPLD